MLSWLTTAIYRSIGEAKEDYYYFDMPVPSTCTKYLLGIRDTRQTLGLCFGLTSSILYSNNLCSVQQNCV